MNWVQKIQGRLKGLTDSIIRYPLAVAFLVALAALIAVRINTHADYTKYILTCGVGAVLGAALQMAWERFFHRLSERLLLMCGGVALVAGYYLLIRPAPELGMEPRIRTWVALFALFIAFIWVPVIRSRVSFNESFMVVFKAFFQSVFYGAVTMGGLSAVIAAIDQLIYPVNSRAYDHTANIVFVLFVPIFFLSLIPIYPGKGKKDDEISDEAINKAANCPRFLEILISYIIIPLTGAFTIILLIYIARNIRGAFWTNNLLEPMLVSYAITVILIYILASRLENKFALIFRRIFPKVLVPIVLFQIASSLLSVTDTGITHTRYYVILFGIFAACAGVVFSFLPVRKNGIVAAMLIGFCAISIIPPMDAFTVSRTSQIRLLENILMQEGMLKGNTITPSGTLSDEDKKKIASSVQYLDRMGYIEQISWLPADFKIYEDFYDTFGFNQYDMPDKSRRFINVSIDPTVAIDISGYDFLSRIYFYGSNDFRESVICEFEKSGKKYSLNRDEVKEQSFIVLTDENKQEMIRFSMGEIFSRYKNYSVDKFQMSGEEAMFFAENDKAKLGIVVQNAGMGINLDQTDYNMDLYILVQLK
jgi:hypothetical protein